MSIEQALTGYLGATIHVLKPHFTPDTSWADPGMPAAAIALDGFRRQITWSPVTGWRFARLYTGTAAQRGRTYYLDAGPVPSPTVVVDRLRRWRDGDITWTDRQPRYPHCDVVKALREAVVDLPPQRRCSWCGAWWTVTPHEEGLCCVTCGEPRSSSAALSEVEGL